MSITPFQPHGQVYTLDLRESAPAEATGPVTLLARSPRGETLALARSYLLRNGRPFIPIMGEFHPSRFPRRYWREELQKMRAGGITLVSFYVFWIHVEEEEGHFDWSDNRDVRAFVELCGSLGLEVLLRIGPFVHGECRNGGLPDWLYGRGIAVRSNDARYLSYVQRYFAEIAAQVAGLLFQDGGPILGVQIENEYMHAGAPWELPTRQGSAWVPRGADGVSHLLRLKELAIAAGLEVPLYTCTAWGRAPVPAEGFLPMHAAYPFTPWVPDPAFEQAPTREFLFRKPEEHWWWSDHFAYDPARYPYAYCELGAGIQITATHRPVVPPECTQALAIVVLGSGCNWPGYYMYHGGSNPPGKHGYLNELSVPRISYDFQAPLGEYGQAAPSYHRLRLLHLFLQEFGEQLAPLPVTLPPGAAQLRPEETGVLRYAARCRQGSGFLFVNNYQDHADTQDFEGVQFQLTLPGETLLMPQRAGLTLRSNMSTILPFNLPLEGGLLLKYATAQPVTRLRHAGRSTYVFLAPAGLLPEFAFARTGCQVHPVTACLLEEDARCLYVRCQPGREALLQLNTPQGETVEVLLLPEEQALAAWKVHLAGQDYLLLTRALVVQEGQMLHLYWRADEEPLVWSCPRLPAPLPSHALWRDEEHGPLFSRYTLAQPATQIDWSFEQSGSELVRIRVASSSLAGLHDALLSIDYVADSAEAYLDGRLVADHFANGRPWEIGLRRFVRPDRDLELVLRFTPLPADTPLLRYFPEEKRPPAGPDGCLPSTLHALKLIPTYHATFMFPPAGHELA